MKILVLLLFALLLTGCASEGAPAAEDITPVLQAIATETSAPDPIQEILNQMSLDERVGQLFLARCEESTALQDIQQYHLGGFVLFGQDFEGETPESIREKLGAYQATAKLPLLIAVDEEGGTVTRISRYPAFRDAAFPSPREACRDGGMVQVIANEYDKCWLLDSLDINVNLGPVCDITDDPEAFLYPRSLGKSAEVTADYVSRTVELMDVFQIGTVLKHFPGYGNNADTHTGIAVDGRSLEELESRDLIPFQAGIDAGCGAILVSHTIVEAMDMVQPASLSPAVHQYLREDMGFEGVIITDDLAMQAITDQYGASEAAVLAVLAGNDLLCSTDYVIQYKAVLDAVLKGRISMDVLNAAVRNVLAWKLDLGLI